VADLGLPRRRYRPHLSHTHGQPPQKEDQRRGQITTAGIWPRAWEPATMVATARAIVTNRLDRLINDPYAQPSSGRMFTPRAVSGGAHGIVCLTFIESQMTTRCQDIRQLISDLESHCRRARLGCPAARSAQRPPPDRVPVGCAMPTLPNPRSMNSIAGDRPLARIKPISKAVESPDVDWFGACLHGDRAE